MVGRGSLAAALWAVAVPIPALAESLAAGSGAGRVPDWALLVGWPVAAALLLGMVAMLVRAHRQEREQAAEVTARIRTEAAIEAAGGAFFLWSRADGTELVSPGVAGVLGLKPKHQEIAFEAVCAALDSADGKRLDAAVARLRDDGKRFSLRLNKAKGGAPIRAIGVHMAASEEGVGAADIVWLQSEGESLAAFDRLAAERDRLHAMLDAMPIPIWTREADLGIVDCNRAYVRAVEASDPAEAIERGLELAGRAIADGGRGLARRALATGKTASASHHIVIDGARRLLDFSEAPIGGGAVAGFALDVTGIEDAQSELTRHVAGHAEVLENLATAIAIFGPDRRLKFFNSAYVRLWQLDEAWLHAEPLFDEVLEALRERRQLTERADFPAWKRTQAKHFTSLIEPLEEQQHLPDGRTLRSVISPHPLGGLLFTFEDVTDRLALERSYNTLIDVQRETLNNLAEAVAVFGGDGRIRLFTPAMERMWNLQDDFLHGEPHFAEVLERVRPLLRYGADWESFKNAIIGRLVRRVRRNGRIERNDGKVLKYGFLPLPDGGVLVTNLDVTDSTRVARALRERNEALEAADRLKSEFIANVSYELRTPLNTIMGFIEILNNRYFGELNERQQEYSQGILESSRELLALIDDILDLAMIEAGSMTLEIETVEIRALLDGVMAQTRERAKSKDLKLRLDCADGIGALELDERRIKHAILNLVGNAVEYTPSGGEIVLSAERLEGEVALAVSDSGIGIAETEQSRIFDMFVRGKKPIGQRRGAGLGLSLVRSFIDLHGGRVEIQSAPGAGTKVTCFLPVRRAGGRAALTADLFPGSDIQPGPE